MLLKTRSILAQASLLALITWARSQSYDVSDEEGDDHSGYAAEGNQRPDYSKYFAADTSSPLSGAQIQGRADHGFVSPIEFSSFFGTQLGFGDGASPAELKPLVAAEPTKDDPKGFVSDKDFKGGFSEYNSDGFGVQDYFEQAQKQEKAEDEEDVESKPGPSYISHRIPPKKGYKSEVEDFRKAKYNPPKPANTEEEGADEQLTEKLNYDYGGGESFKPSPSLDLAQFQPTNPTKILEAPTVNLNNLPISPEYFKKYTDAAAQVTPYQKYSFQPAPAATNFGLKEASILNAFQSTAAPFNPSYGKLASTAATNYEYQPSEIVSQNLRNKDCIKVHKEVTDKAGKFERKPMNCYVCKDPKTGGKYEQCSYSSEPTPKSYYQTTSQSYVNPHAESYRNKRDESESYSDPYEEIKAKSHKYYSQPDAFEKEYYKTPDLSKISEDYSYNPETFYDKEAAEDKSSSEIQSEELVKQGENCKKSHKDGVTCMVCKNPKTGANYEQCSYESAPNEKKYAYVRESKYDGDGNPIEEKVVDSTNPKPVVSAAETLGQLRRSDNAENADEAGEQPQETKQGSDEEVETRSKLVSDAPYDIPSHFEESTSKRQSAGVRGLDPELYGGLDSSEISELNEDDRGPQKFSNLDEYHLKLFPQFSNEETKREETRAQPDNPYFEDLTGKKDVEKVLEEFTKKDRSNCKQITKKGMTCYLCVNDKGIQQEECMYVSESRPQSSHVAYHEVQHIKVPEKPNVTESESQIQPVQVAADESQKKKKFFKKATLEDSVAHASSNVETRIKFTPAVAASSNAYQKVPKDKRSPKNYKSDKRTESIDPEPEFDVNDEGGLYSAETRPVYSEEIGMVLPKYMLEVTPFEADFDKTVQES